MRHIETPENQNPNAPRDLGQIGSTAKSTPKGKKKAAAAAATRPSLSETVKRLNGMRVGALGISVQWSRQYNEVSICLNEHGDGVRRRLSTSYIDVGHSAADRQVAAATLECAVKELLGLVD